MHPRASKSSAQVVSHPRGCLLRRSRVTVATTSLRRTRISGGQLAGCPESALTVPFVAVDAETPGGTRTFASSRHDEYVGCMQPLVQPNASINDGRNILFNTKKGKSGPEIGIRRVCHVFS